MPLFDLATCDKGNSSPDKTALCFGSSSQDVPNRTVLRLSEIARINNRVFTIRSRGLEQPLSLV